MSLLPKWEISMPKYESDLITPKLQFAYWEGHRDFVYDFVKFVKPNRIVELGSQYGCSLFAFCQAVKDFKLLQTEIHAVDFWKDDIGATDPGELVYQSVEKIKNSFYKALNIKLYPMSFDEAVHYFEDNSIDLLHIDGGHRFEDVEHDFNLWLPKLKDNGVILFHDVYSTIDKGSCEHWLYLKSKFDTFFEFDHSFGLGVLFPKGDYWYQKLINAGFDNNIKDLYKFRSQYYYKNRRFDELAGLYEERYEIIQNQSKMISERDTAIEAQAKLIEERYEVIENQSKMIAERDAAIKAQAKLAEERYEVIENQSKMIAERDTAIEAQAKLIEERYEVIENQSKMIAERDTAIKAQAKLIEERYEVIENQSKMIAERDAAIKAQAKLAEERYEVIQSQSKMISERDTAIEAQAKLIEERYEVIQNQSKMISERDDAIKEQVELNKINSDNILKFEEKIDELSKQLSNQMDINKNSLNEIEKLKQLVNKRRFFWEEKI